MLISCYGADFEEAYGCLVRKCSNWIRTFAKGMLQSKSDAKITLYLTLSRHLGSYVAVTKHVIRGYCLHICKSKNAYGCKRHQKST